MRQAGRYLPEYQEIREKASFMDICRTPSLMAEVTRQPVDIFGFDAAIMFSDILLPLEPLGVSVDFQKGGPVLSPPVRQPEDVERLSSFDPEAELGFVLDGIRNIKNVLNSDTPLIGFCGAPFTMAYYAIEGGGSKGGSEIKRFIYQHPRAAHKLLGMIAELVGEYLVTQISAGVDAVKLFDSRAGILSTHDYRKFALPYVKRVFEICGQKGVPRLLFMENCRPFLKHLSEVECEVVSIDWRTEIPDAMRVLDGKTVQGNLDPHVLLAAPDVLREETLRVLDSVENHDRYIFNLGHGILPQVPVGNVHLLVDTVHSYRCGSTKDDKSRITSKI